MKRLNVLLLALLLGCSLFALPASAAEGIADAPKTEAVSEVPTVKQLRGKLLYKRNQIRKLEKAAVNSDASIQGKVHALEEQIEAIYVAADPKLEALYKAEKELLRQIEEATPKK